MIWIKHPYADPLMSYIQSAKTQINSRNYISRSSYCTEDLDWLDSSTQHYCRYEQIICNSLFVLMIVLVKWIYEPNLRNGQNFAWYACHVSDRSTACLPLIARMSTRLYNLYQTGQLKVDRSWTQVIII